MDQEVVEEIIEDLSNVCDDLQFCRVLLNDLEDNGRPVQLRLKIARSIARSESIIRRALKPIPIVYK